MGESAPPAIRSASWRSRASTLRAQGVALLADRVALGLDLPQLTAPGRGLAPQRARRVGLLLDGVAERLRLTPGLLGLGRRRLLPTLGRVHGFSRLRLGRRVRVALNAGGAHRRCTCGVPPLGPACRLSSCRPTQASSWSSGWA